MVCFSFYKRLSEIAYILFNISCFVVTTIVYEGVDFGNGYLCIYYLVILLIRLDFYNPIFVDGVSTAKEPVLI